jgi:tRNA modification GTPase
MYPGSDTIAAISSPAAEGRVIIRISGPGAVPAASKLFKPEVQSRRSGIVNGRLVVDSQTEVDAKIYLFRSPHSYTGEDIVEIHLYTNRQIADALMERLFAVPLQRVRQAGPGEFTARSFLNGKIDLSQAEAVNQIISSSNKFQLDSAERLLSGRLTGITDDIRRQLLDCLSLLEAGLDFSEETIEFISCRQAAQRLKRAKRVLDDLLAGAISYEILTELPSVGIAGAPNAGKSSLFNALLGSRRSIVSSVRKTTRDILTGTLTMGRMRCVLFDCAGLMETPQNIIEQLSCQAAIEGLDNCDLVVFCVDASKNIAELTEDMQIRRLIKPKSVLSAATRADLLSPAQLSKRMEYLRKIFGNDFLATSSKTGFGVERLKKAVEEKILAKAFGRGGRKAMREIAALTNRHRQAVCDASEGTGQAVDALKEGSSEAAAMFIRSAISSLGEVGQSIDEAVLDRIFRTFCIGK